MKEKDLFLLMFIIFLSSVTGCYVGCEACKQIGATAQKNGNVVWATNSTTTVTFKIKE